MTECWPRRSFYVSENSNDNADCRFFIPSLSIFRCKLKRASGETEENFRSTHGNHQHIDAADGMKRDVNKNLWMKTVISACAPQCSLLSIRSFDGVNEEPFAMVFLLDENGREIKLTLQPRILWNIYWLLATIFIQPEGKAMPMLFLRRCTSKRVNPRFLWFESQNEFINENHAREISLGSRRALYSHFNIPTFRSELEM